MIRTLRAFFLSRLFREKLLLVGFLGIAVIMWASAFSSRARRFWHAQAATTQELQQQDALLRQRPAIEAATQAAAAQMDPAKTLDATGLSVEVSRIANDAGVRINTGNVTPGPNAGQFAINTLRIQVPSADWHAFAVFYQHLQERAPYIAITQITMEPVPRNPAQVRAALDVASFQIKH
jgi:hypothetical protein